MIDARELMIGDCVQVHESYIDKETGEKENNFCIPIDLFNELKESIYE